jgi:hypothetical protein
MNSKRIEAVVELSESGIERLVLVGQTEADFTRASDRITKSMPELIRLQKAWSGQKD